MTYQEATELSLKTRWKTEYCESGKECWCRRIVPEIDITDKDGNSIYIVGSGLMQREHAKHIVKLHNESLNHEQI